MVTVDFEGNNYLYSKSDTSGVWVGNGGPKQGRYPGLHCAAPTIMYPAMVIAAIEQGADKSEFVFEKKEKKASKPRASKPKKNSISIF
jgi:hypothetical protein